jgi:hypothetical protein
MCAKSRRKISGTYSYSTGVKFCTTFCNGLLMQFVTVARWGLMTVGSVSSLRWTCVTYAQSLYRQWYDREIDVSHSWRSRNWCSDNRLSALSQCALKAFSHRSHIKNCTLQWLVQRIIILRLPAGDCIKRDGLLYVINQIWAEDSWTKVY